MTEEQIHLVRESWEQLKPTSRQIGRSLYDRLFVALPVAKHLFDEDIHQQACKLAAVISFVITKLHRIEDIYPDLRNVGGMHSKYDIPFDWYNIVGNCLVASIKDGMGTQWTEKLEEAWNSLYDILREKVWEGQQGLSQSPH